MKHHPVIEVSWYGAVCFCNWLSEMEGGMTSCYDLSTWELTVPFANGYRLPTEAEWERAAAWSGSMHWIYGFQSHNLTDKNHCNCIAEWSYVNPLGLSANPYTSAATRKIVRRDPAQHPGRSHRAAGESAPGYSNATLPR